MGASSRLLVFSYLSHRFQELSSTFQWVSLVRDRYDLHKLAYYASRKMRFNAINLVIGFSCFFLQLDQGLKDFNLTQFTESTSSLGFFFLHGNLPG